MKKRVLITLLLFVVTTIFSIKLLSPQQESVELEPKDETTLVVAMDQNQHGYFTINDDNYGYWYEILNNYCQYTSQKLIIVPKLSTSHAFNLLEKGSVDMVLSTINAIDGHQFTAHQLGDVYNGKYVIVANKKLLNSSKKVPFKQSELKEEMKHANIVMSNSFTSTKAYNVWLNSVNRGALISHDAPFEMLKKCSEGDFDYVICPKTEAHIASLQGDDLQIVYEFKEKVNSVLLTSIQNKELELNFNQWHTSFSQTSLSKTIAQRYIQGSIIDLLRSRGLIKPQIVISQYDQIIKTHSKALGYDWRLISAIAYNESRFKPQAKSQVGARGIMQVMPHIAKSFNVGEDEIDDPSTNVEVALKLFKSIESSISFAPSTSQIDKISLILASYNGGLGRIYDARRLALKYKLNPDKWEDISYCISQMSKEEVYTDKAVLHGKFKGTETIQFVDRVLNQYNKYCLIAAL